MYVARTRRGLGDLPVAFSDMSAAQQAAFEAGNSTGISFQDMTAAEQAAFEAVTPFRDMTASQQAAFEAATPAGSSDDCSSAFSVFNSACNPNSNIWFGGAVFGALALISMALARGR